MSQFDIRPSATPRTAAEREAILAAPGFGKHFTDHMVTLPYSDGAWGTPTVEAYAPLSIDPSAVVLHYAQTIFEGLKAYRQADDSIASFRPEQNAARFNRSAQRLAMPTLPEELFMESLRQIVAIDRDWVPAAGGEASSTARSRSESRTPESMNSVAPSSVGMIVRPASISIAPTTL